MKKILFKAWNIKEKRMYPVISINIITNEVVVDTIAISEDYKKKIPTLTYKYPEEVILLQFIGTCDINKTDIFEGDIVRWKEPMEGYIRNDYIIGVVEYPDKAGCFIIKQLTEGMNITEFFQFRSENYTRFYDEESQVFDWKDVEVVGNKYENPDLAISKIKKYKED